MKLFNDSNKTSTDEQVAGLFKKSRTLFKFDQKQIKDKILNQIEEQQISKATKLISNINSASFLRRHPVMTAFGIAILVTAGSGAALSQAGIYQPATTLNALGHMQEEVMLKLPLPASQKASIQMRIAESRSKKVEQILQGHNQMQERTETLDHSGDIMTQAIEQISASKQKQSEQGKLDDEEKYKMMLERLAEMANQQETVVTELINNTEPDSPRAQELHHHLERIQTLKLKAQNQINVKGMKLEKKNPVK